MDCNLIQSKVHFVKYQFAFDIDYKKLIGCIILFLKKIDR